MWGKSLYAQRTYITDPENGTMKTLKEQDLLNQCPVTRKRKRKRKRKKATDSR